MNYPQDGNLLDDQTLAGFSSFGRKSNLKKEPLTSPTRLVKSLKAPQTQGYPAPVPDPVKFYAPPPPPPPPSPPATLYNAPPPPPPPSPPPTLYNAPEVPKPTEPPSLYLPPPIFAQPTEPTLSQYIPPAPSAPVLEIEVPETPAPMMMQMDASYNFNFDSDDSFREEESDPSGNIRGKYRYVNADGNTIEVIYSAGAEKGFVIENEQELLSSVAKATKDAANKTKKRMRVVKKPRTKPQPLPTPATLYSAPPLPRYGFKGLLL